MKSRAIMWMIGGTVLTLVATVTLPQAQKAPGTDGQAETKISESRKNGKYERTTEVFQDKVLVTKKQEVSTHDDGKIDVVFVKLFRDGAMIYASTFYQSKNRTIRSYYHQGKIIVEEGDEDGDGVFEVIILFNSKEQPAEAFLRSKDGTVRQFGKEKLSELKKSFVTFQ